MSEIKIVREHRPVVSLERDMFGGVSVMVDKFEFVHINYSYRVTNNAHRSWLAEKIKSLVEGDPLYTAGQIEKAKSDEREACAKKLEDCRVTVSMMANSRDADVHNIAVGLCARAIREITP